MATFRKRGDLQWEARIRKRGYPTTCKTFETKGEAEAWAKETETEMNRGRFVSAKEAETHTLEECLERFKVEYLPRYKDPKREIVRIEAMKKRVLAKRVMSTIRIRDIAEYSKSRAENDGVSPNTIRLELALLSKLFNFAKGAWGMESLSNPVQFAPKPKIPKGRERRLEKGEEEKLFESIGDDLEFRAIVEIALETAMRRGEIVNLQWKDFNFEKRTVLLSDTKNGKSRTVPLSKRAIDMFNALPRHISGRVFTSFTHPDSISSKMIRICKTAGLENFHFHDLRHEATSRLFEKTNLDMIEIKGITGHESVQVLAKYAHLRAGRLACRLDGARRGEAQA